jgi:hypothetical protein
VNSKHVCKLNKSLYGLKQAPRAWYTLLATFLGELGFTPTRSDSGQNLVYLLLYVDDIVITASSSALLRDITATINAEFKLKDMGALHYFLGIQVHRSSNGFFLHQHQYALDLLDRAGMKTAAHALIPLTLLASSRLSPARHSPTPTPHHIAASSGLSNTSR